jgi:C1A family cysteine protease
MKKFLIGLLLCCAAASPSFTAADKADVKEKQPAKVKYHRGRVAPKNVQALRQADIRRNNHHIRKLPRIAAAQFDCVALGWTCPVLDQASCGSCWDFSGTEMVTSAFIKPGLQKNDGSFILSPQYTLDCYSNGGCNGDDNTTVLQHAQATGLPTQQAYGPYVGNIQRCQFKSSMQLYQISNWGYCTSGNDEGVANTADIKAAMVQYGGIGCAVAADNAFENYQAGTVFDATTSQSIDHDVFLVGWDDTKGKNGAWKMQNSWNTSWGNGGYMWIGYGVNLIGTEAVWCTVAAPTPPPPGPTPPSPVPPGPTPPPPTPGQPLTVTFDAALPDGDFVIRATNSRVSGNASTAIPAGTYTLTLPTHQGKAPCPCQDK